MWLAMLLTAGATVPVELPEGTGFLPLADPLDETRGDLYCTDVAGTVVEADSLDPGAHVQGADERSTLHDGRPEGGEHLRHRARPLPGGGPGRGRGIALHCTLSSRLEAELVLHGRRPDSIRPTTRRSAGR